MDSEKNIEMMHAAQAVFNRIGLDACIASSSLLGIIRDGNPLGIPDFMCLAEDLNQVIDKLKEDKCYLRNSGTDLMVISLEFGGRVELLPFQKQGSKRYLNPREDKVLVFSDEYFDKSKWTEYQEFKLPYNPEGFLNEYYGHDWRTPKKFHWHEAPNLTTMDKLNPKVVYTGGTFDLFHWGHANFLKECNELGEVVVALNRDEFVTKFKNKTPIMNFEERKKVLLSCKYVSRVIENFGNEDSKPVIETIKPDIIAIGDDWKDKDYYKQMGFDSKWLTQRGIELKYIPYTKEISSTIIRSRL